MTLKERERKNFLRFCFSRLCAKIFKRRRKTSWQKKRKKTVEEGMQFFNFHRFDSLLLLPNVSKHWFIQPAISVLIFHRDPVRLGGEKIWRALQKNKKKKKYIKPCAKKTRDDRNRAWKMKIRPSRGVMMIIVYNKIEISRIFEKGR